MKAFHIKKTNSRIQTESEKVGLLEIQQLQRGRPNPTIANSRKTKKQNPFTFSKINNNTTKSILQPNKHPFLNTLKKSSYSTNRYEFLPYNKTKNTLFISFEKCEDQ